MLFKMVDVNNLAGLLEWPESETLTVPNAGKEMEQRELSFVAGVNVNWYRQFGSFLKN